MKKTYYMLITVLLLSSCKSIQKMVDKGEYDKAIYFATDKLAGKKTKKTKYVKGLERAFNKITAKDLVYIESLNTPKNPERWDLVYATLDKMYRRQDKVSSLTPLLSNDGYVAHFNFLNYNTLMAEASQGAAEYRYKVAMAYINNAQDKNDYRSAYYELEKIDRYFKHYKEKEQLKTRSIALGQTNILVNYANTNASIGGYIGDFWTKFHLSNPTDIIMDYQIDFDIARVDLGVERERENNFVERKEVKDGFVYEYDAKGNVKKDSLGNDIKKDRFITVESIITEIFREKTASATAIVTIHDLRQKSIVHETPLLTEVVFKSEACSHRGDRRALSSRVKNRLNKRLESFPTDDALLWDVESRLQEDFIHYLNNLDVI